MSGAYLDIANHALERLGEPQLGAWPSREEAGKRAERSIEKAIKYVAKRALWTDLTVTDCPSRAPIDECHLPTNLCYAFHLPADFGRMVDVCVEGTGVWRSDRKNYNVLWSVRKVDGNQVLLTNCDNIKITYICVPGCDDDISCDFIELAGLRLAYYMAPELKANRTMRNDIMVDFRDLLMEADGISSAQDQTDTTVPQNGFLTQDRMGEEDIFTARGADDLLFRRY